VLTDDEDRILEVLDDSECLRLLTTARLGRLGFTDGALPAIVPVPFALSEGSLVIPARRGHWVVGAMRGSVVAFAVDSYDVDARTGWGVTVVGPSRVLPHPWPAADQDGLVHVAAPPGAGHCSIVVQLGLLRGWRQSLPSTTARGVPDPAIPVG
jgi:uncharacterized protein